MNARLKLSGSLLALVLAFASLFSVASAQPEVATGTAALTVVECSSISSHGVMSSIPADCVTAGGLFTFYLRDDGSADFEQLLVPESDGLGSLNLTPGVYEVVEENTQTHFEMTVTSGVTTQTIFGFASGILPEEQPSRLSITSLVCVNYEAASFIVFDGTVPAECTQVGGDVFSLYMYDDGTDDFVQVTSSATNAAYIDLMPGRYELVHEGSQMSTELVINSGSDISMAFTLPAPVNNGPPTQAPTPDAVNPTQATVKALPDTGIGEGNDIGVMVMAAAAGAVLLAGASIRIRQSS